MKYEQQKTYSFQARRPQVLFLGNGLFYHDCSWDEFIDRCKRSDLDFNDWKNFKDSIPYSIRANIACDFDDKIRRDKYSAQLQSLKNESNIYVKDNRFLKELLDLPFDAVLTTNYTYQIENCLDKTFVEKSNSQKNSKYARCTQKDKDSKFLLHTFNQVNNHEIWHIHGEERRKTSMVLTHDEYGRLSTEIGKYFRESADRYIAENEEFTVFTWMDYMLFADVYVLGYGADFAEFDFWWLLGRRMREKSPVGSIYFYEPLIDKSNVNNASKNFALAQSGIHVEHLGFSFHDYYEDYASFYEAAVKDIGQKISEPLLISSETAS